MPDQPPEVLIHLDAIDLGPRRLVGTLRRAGSGLRSAISLAIDEAVRAPDLELVRETAPFYRLSRGRADAIVEEVRRSVAGWRQAAQAIHIPATEVELMATAFAR